MEFDRKSHTCFGVGSGISMAHVHLKKTQAERDYSMLKNIWDAPFVRMVDGLREHNAWERQSPRQNAWKGRSLEEKVATAENVALRVGALGAGAMGAGALGLSLLKIKFQEAEIEAQDKKNSKIEKELAVLREDLKKANEEGYGLGYKTREEGGGKEEESRRGKVLSGQE